FHPLLPIARKQSGAKRTRTAILQASNPPYATAEVSHLAGRRLNWFCCSPLSTSAIVGQSREDDMRLIGAALVALLCAEPAMAQAFKPAPVDEAAAKREGKVTWYTSTPVATGQFIANEFERRYGIKVEMLRTGGQNVIRRFMQEAEAGRITVDMI